MSTAKELAAALTAQADPERAAHSARYFKTGPGEYGEGDQFLGLPVPLTRSITRAHLPLPVSEAQILLTSELHEHRLSALLALVATFESASRKRTWDDGVREATHEAYLSAVRLGQVNNWDLVDTSAPTLAGSAWRTGVPSSGDIDAFATSPQLWERRVAVLACYSWILEGSSEPAFRIVTRVLDDSEDLMHKAAGWMLREVGKRVSEAELLGYLDAFAGAMPRTALSYATEHLTPQQRAYYRAIPRTTLCP